MVFPDGLIWAGQAGSAILSPQTPVTADTLFSIGSISKTFVAALAGRLAARGTISLDDPLAKYVPTFHDAASITLRQLLNHTSGVQDPFADPDMAEAILANPGQPWTTAQVLSWIGRPYAFAPGKGYHYSNTNFVLLGEVVEKATGQSLASLVRSEFLTPLGLTHTFLQTEETVPGNKAHGYMAPAGPRDNSAGTMIPFTAEATAVGPAGAYVSTATDLARWGDALYGGNVLDQAHSPPWWTSPRRRVQGAVHAGALALWPGHGGDHHRRADRLGPSRPSRWLLVGDVVSAGQPRHDRRHRQRGVGRPGRRRGRPGQGNPRPRAGASPSRP